MVTQKEVLILSLTTLFEICNVKCLILLLQHLLSPQRAPERLLQVAQKNLATLVTEMDELLTRVSFVGNGGDDA